MNAEFVYPPNNGWITARLPDEAMAKLWEYIDAREENFKSNLAGNLTESNQIKDTDDWFTKNVLSHLTTAHINEYGGPSDIPASNPTRFKLILNDFWVNFQKKHEFNPIHSHRNCLYSFVVWMKIPTDWREQHELDFIKKSNTPCASDFVFQYQDILGEVCSYYYRLDKESEGTIVLFPAKLKHVVYPFYNSDETRISISGNIGLNI